MAPGQLFVDLLANHLPWVVSALSLDTLGGRLIFAIIFSTLVWVLLCVAIYGAFRFVSHANRVTNLVVRTAIHQVSEFVNSIRTHMVCRLRRLSNPKKADTAELETEIEIGNFDFAVLQATADCGGDKAVSAKDLASRFNLRPAQFAASLQKLHENRMLEAEGKQGYRITDHGEAFVRMWRQKIAV